VRPAIQLDAGHRQRHRASTSAAGGIRQGTWRLRLPVDGRVF
jgi:hypothetical protein